MYDPPSNLRKKAESRLRKVLFAETFDRADELSLMSRYIQSGVGPSTPLLPFKWQTRGTSGEAVSADSVMSLVPENVIQGIRPTSDYLILSQLSFAQLRGKNLDQFGVTLDGNEHNSS
ncbi:hypothetical protein STEG23_037060 [Scotinomys teguina]